MKICVEAMPPEYEFEPGHKAACWLYHPDSVYQDIDLTEGV